MIPRKVSDINFYEIQIEGSLNLCEYFINQEPSYTYIYYVQ